jgi:hypothetical protein
MRRAGALFKNCRVILRSMQGYIICWAAQGLRELFKPIERFANKRRTALGIFSTANLAFIGVLPGPAGFGKRVEGPA